MAIYHLRCKIFSRSKGQTAVAAAAYRSGTKLIDHETGIVSDYTKKSGIKFSEISLCTNAPQKYSDREILWNEVQQIEKNRDAQLCREFEVALPVELSLSEQIDLVRAFVKTLTNEGMCVDWSIHDKGDGNPHAHILTTMRPIDIQGNWMSKQRKVYSLDNDGNKIPIIDKKTGQQKIGARGRKMWKRETVESLDWNTKEKLLEWRERWADICNSAIDKKNEGIELNNLSVNLYAQEPLIEHIDHRSYADRGIDRIPTIHEGWQARKMGRLGFKSDRLEENRQIKEINSIWSRLMGILNKYKEKNQMHYQDYQREVDQHGKRIGYIKSGTGGNPGNHGHTRETDQYNIYRIMEYPSTEREAIAGPEIMRKGNQSSEDTQSVIRDHSLSSSEILAIAKMIVEDNFHMEKGAASILDALFNVSSGKKKKKRNHLELDR